MKVLVFSELFHPHGGGAELATWLYCRALVQHGFDVSVITRRFSNELSAELCDGIKVYRYPFHFDAGGRYETFINAGIISSRFVNEKVSESDLVYVPGLWYSAIPLAKMYRKPVVVHLHNYSLTCPTSLMYDFVNQQVGRSSGKSFLLHEMIQKGRRGRSVFVSCFMNEGFGKHINRLLTAADALVFVSDAQMQLSMSVCAGFEEKSYMVYNPIPNCPLVRSERMGIGYFGGNNFLKGLAVLMRALRSLGDCHANVYATMFREGPKTLEMVNGAKIHFLPRLGYGDLMKIMGRLSIVVAPSIWPEPLPYVVVEAVLRGKLVVASNIGGIPEIVRGLTGGVRLVEPSRHEEVAKALDEFMDVDLLRANEIGAENRRVLLRRFNNGESVKSFMRILETVS
jgi:glycosyltransferase involved in cell wall biosynthesis